MYKKMYELYKKMPPHMYRLADHLTTVPHLVRKMDKKMTCNHVLDVRDVQNDDMYIYDVLRSILPACLSLYRRRVHRQVGWRARVRALQKIYVRKR